MSHVVQPSRHAGLRDRNAVASKGVASALTSKPSAGFGAVVVALFAGLLWLPACDGKVPVNDNGCEGSEDCSEGERCERGECTSEPATPLPTPEAFEPAPSPGQEPSVGPEAEEPEPAAQPEPTPGPLVEPDTPSPAAQPEPEPTPSPTPSPTPNPAPNPEPEPEPEPAPAPNPEPDPPCNSANVDEVCEDTEYCFNGDCFNLPLCPGGSCPAGLFCHASTGRCDRDPCVGAECGSCTASSCNDGQFCNGTETCDGVNCSPGTPPCAGACDESIDRCVECVQPSDCPIANETCVNNFCECVPQCTGRNCGADGCGGTCGTCGGSQTCNANGVCESDGDVCDQFVDDTALSGFADLNGSLNAPADPSFIWGTGTVSTRERLLDDFTISPVAGEEWEITLRATHDSFLYVYDVSGGACTEVVFNDDLAVGDRDSQVVFTPGSGTYRVVATTFVENQEGPYTLEARETVCGKPLVDAAAYNTCKGVIENYTGGDDPCTRNLCVDFGNSREFCCFNGSTFCTDTFGDSIGVAGADFEGSCGT